MGPHTWLKVQSSRSKCGCVLEAHQSRLRAAGGEQGSFEGTGKDDDNNGKGNDEGQPEVEAAKNNKQTPRNSCMTGQF